MLKFKKWAVEKNKTSKSSAITPYQEHEVQKTTDCWLFQECLSAVSPGTSEKQDPKFRNTVSQKSKTKFLGL